MRVEGVSLGVEGVWRLFAIPCLLIGAPRVTFREGCVCYHPTRWITHLSSQLNLPHTMAFCGTHLSRYTPQSGVNKTFENHRGYCSAVHKDAAKELLQDEVVACDVVHLQRAWTHQASGDHSSIPSLMTFPDTLSRGDFGHLQPHRKGRVQPKSYLRQICCEWLWDSRDIP